MRTALTRESSRAAALSAVASLLGLAAIAAAGDEPAFRYGQWQFDRTVQNPGGAPQKLSNSKCVDPGADWVAQRQKMTKLGCQVTPTVRSGSTYRFTATCKIGSVTAISDNVLKLDSPDSYSVTVESDTAGMKTHESLVARRTGDCGK